MSEQCCCGHVRPCTEPSVTNSTMHEPLGAPGAFCGPVDRHTVRDQAAEIERLEAALGQARADLFGCQDGALVRDQAAEIERLRKIEAWMRQTPGLRQAFDGWRILQERRK